VYGIFAQACWAQYDDKAGIEEFHIQCSDWWEHLAEKEREKFQSLATRSDADKNPSSRRLTSTRSDADEMSGFLTPDVDERHFSRLNAGGRSGFSMPRSRGDANKSPSSRQLTSTRSDTGVDERHFSTPRPGGPSRRAEARQTQNKLKGSKVHPRRRRLRRHCKTDCRRGVQLKGLFDRGRKLLFSSLSAHFVLRQFSIIFVCLTIILDVDFFVCLFGL
jgi:hypothetical protein